MVYKKKKKKNSNDIILEMAQNPLVQVEGEATGQIIEAYKGVRYDHNGVDLNHKGRSLKGIKKYKINVNYKKQNIKQQSGFDAELIHEARKNKEYIRQRREIRIRTTDGIGCKNDTKYDHIKTTLSGDVIKGSESQMKFYSSNHKRGEDTYSVIDKIVKNHEWDRYDKYIDIPAEQYEGAKKYAQNKAKELRQQSLYNEQHNKFNKAKELNEKALRYENASNKIRKSTVSTNDAILARLEPEKFVIREVVNDVNGAGIKAAKATSIVTASVSTAQNIYSVMSNDKKVDQALVDITKDIAKAGAIGYGVGATGTTIKAIMHTSNKEIVRRCSNTAIPTIIASSVIEVGKSFKKYACDEINEEELVIELSEKGTGLTASAFGAAVGATIGGGLGSIIPVLGTGTGALVGEFIGSMVGYASSTMLYEGALSALKGARVSKERRGIIEHIVGQAIQSNNYYVEQLNSYLKESKEEFSREVSKILSNIQKSILNNDFENYIYNIDKLGAYFGIKLDFKTFDDFNQVMESEDEMIYF